MIREDMDIAFWRQAGRYKAIIHRVSLADCFAITLANRIGGELVTSDHREMDPIAASGERMRGAHSLLRLDGAGAIKTVVNGDELVRRSREMTIVGD